MAGPKKRKATAQTNGDNPSKKAKSQHPNPKPKLKTKTKPKSTLKKPVSIDSLRWRKAELPDMFDDAEGFYGLEEIDDVEIVRNNNIVEFVRAPLSYGPVPLCA